MSDSAILERLHRVIQDRKSTRPEGSYVVTLLDGGLDAMAAKLREEAEELIEATGAGNLDHAAREAADLVFHAWVLLASIDLAPERVYAVLEERFGVGGLVEKASRSVEDEG